MNETSQADLSRYVVIAVVDDDPDIGFMIISALHRAGYAATAFASAQAALKQLRAQKFDVVITDVFMPDCDGFELLVELSRLESPPQVIAMSGGDVQMLRVARHLGACLILPKPFLLDTLIETVRAALHARQTSRQAMPVENASQEKSPTPAAPPRTGVVDGA